MIKKVCFMVLLLLFCPFGVFALEVPSIESTHAILYNFNNHEILYEKASEEEISIASLTKIMTAIIALENLSLDDQITITWEDFQGLYEVGASVAGFQYHDVVSVKDLLYGLLLPSGAEAAQALTRMVGKEKFYQLMNEKAEALGMNHTHFVNETGLDEEGHYSTVKDVAKMFSYALENETFRTIIETPSYTTSTGLTVYSTVLGSKNRNHLAMDYLLGGKSGTTNQAGLCLASIAFENDVSYLLVTCGAPNDWKTPKHLLDSKTLYDYFMTHYENVLLVEEKKPVYEIETKYAQEEKIVVYPKEKIIKYLPKDYSPNDLKISYDEKRQPTPFVPKNELLGTMTIQYQDEVLSSFDIFYEGNLTIDYEYFLFHYGWILGLVVLLIGLWIFYRKKRKKKRK